MLLGKDVKDAARKKIKEWLEAMTKERRVDLFEKLLTNLYRTEYLKQEYRAAARDHESVRGRAQPPERIGIGASDKFIVLRKPIGSLAEVIAFANLVKAPHFASIATGLRMALPTVLVYSRLRLCRLPDSGFSELHQSIGEVIEEALA
jgi:hypothetical protein